MRGPALLVALSSAAWGWAQQTAPAVPAYEPGHYLVQALLSLFVVVVLIYGAYYLLRRLQSPVLRVGHSGPLRLVQSLPLSGGNMLHLVEVGEQTVMLASGPQGVSLVEPVAVEAEGGAAWH